MQSEFLWYNDVWENFHKTFQCIDNARRLEYLYKRIWCIMAPDFRRSKSKPPSPSQFSPFFAPSQRKTQRFIMAITHAQIHHKRWFILDVDEKHGKFHSLKPLEDIRSDHAIKTVSWTIIYHISVKVCLQDDKLTGIKSWSK